jgi:hypothetical protein
VDDEDRELWTALLALGPSEDPGHDPDRAGGDEWPQRRDRLRSCDACRDFLLEVWRGDREKRPVH